MRVTPRWCRSAASGTNPSWRDGCQRSHRSPTSLDGIDASVMGGVDDADQLGRDPTCEQWRGEGRAAPHGEPAGVVVGVDGLARAAVDHGARYGLKPALEG